MAKTLELQFNTEFGKVARLALDNPKEPVNETAVKQAMQQIISSDVFTSGTGKYISIKGARMVDRNTTDYEMA